MWRYLVGAVAALLMVAAGTLWFTTRAGNPAPLLPAAAPAQAEGAPLPEAAPEAPERSREQRRFARYDADEDGRVTRAEMLAPRRKAFAKLDANGDGALSFDEWAVKTVKKFEGADANRDGALVPAEFATTAPKRRPRPKCACPPVAKAEEES
ncbi:MAG: histidine kinase [Proteobacteria bacterium SG_bin5]|nr:MAG: histidine kinase [Proteobacteria bacterium SG_bin5]